MASKGEILASRITQHLRRFEADHEINEPDPKYRTVPYYYAGAYRVGRYIRVVYISYQSKNTLTFDTAEKYADWLDAGNVGKHWNMEAPRD